MSTLPASDWLEMLAAKLEDPDQNMEHTTDTPLSQMQLALNTLTMEFGAEETGTVLTQDDKAEAEELIGKLRSIVDRVTVKLAAYVSETGEKPASKGKP